LANLPDECVHHGVAIFAFHLNQHEKAGSPFYQRGDMTIFGSAQQIAFPMAWYLAILNLGGSAPDRHRIDNLALGLPRGAGCLAPSHDPATPQMGHQLFLRHSTGLNKQAFVNCFVADMHSSIAIIRDPEPTRHFLR
jgi:hypothetical protein